MPATPVKRKNWFVKDLTVGRYFLTALGREKLAPVGIRQGLPWFGPLLEQDLENLFIEEWLMRANPEVRQALQGDF